MNTITRITNAAELTAALGDTSAFRKKVLMAKREPVAPEERVQKWGEELVGKPGEHFMLMKPDDHSDFYPIEISLFEKTYEETEPGSGLYRKSALTNAVQVPQGQTFEVVSLESSDSSKAEHPHYIARGANDEVWVISQETIAKDFEPAN